MEQIDIFKSKSLKKHREVVLSHRRPHHSNTINFNFHNAYSPWREHSPTIKRFYHTPGASPLGHATAPDPALPLPTMSSKFKASPLSHKTMGALEIARHVAAGTGKQCVVSPQKQGLHRLSTLKKTLQAQRQAGSYYSE